MAGLKVAVLVPDGAADRPLEVLGGLTPLQKASLPNADKVAREGVTGTAATVPKGMPAGSDVANLSLMGFDPVTHYGGRAPIEAANLGIEIPDGWTAFRCNLVRTDGVRMLDYSASHISDEDAGRCVATLSAALNDEDTAFYPGKSYRSILLLRGDYAGVECTPPHDITDEPMEPYLPRGSGASRLLELMEVSKGLLSQMDDPPADMIWPWGQGGRMELESFSSLFGMSGSVISAVDLVNGIGLLTGLKPVAVRGATGFLDTDYAAKGRAAVRALHDDDFVYVHVEAPDEASHMGDAAEKVLALERFDESVVGPVLEHLRSGPDPYRLLVAPDHPTLISTRTHDGSTVPYAACGVGIAPSGADGFSEEDAASGGPHFERGWTLMAKLTGPGGW
jgi:2,3-bisphosphoglycerate-independent phosphoglycerate mutase